MTRLYLSEDGKTALEAKFKACYKSEGLQGVEQLKLAMGEPERAKAKYWCELIRKAKLDQENTVTVQQAAEIPKYGNKDLGKLTSSLNGNKKASFNDEGSV